MEWLGSIVFIGIGLVFIGIGLLAVFGFIAHLKAKKKVKEGILYSGVDYLVNALKDATIREEAIEALGKTKDPRAVEALIALVNSPAVREEEDKHTLSLGLNALAETEDPKALGFLIAELNDKDWVVRCFVCPPLSMLAQKGIKDFRAIEPLITLLKDIKDMKRKKDSGYDSMFEGWVEDTLKIITGKDFGADPEKWEKWWEENKTKINGRDF
ncbi:MAG: HEAT repeat domain-containing protein [Desulfomonile sp.]|nr:HEAT repeat domain-containing protein [Desulfomonile sp.]